MVRGDLLRKAVISEALHVKDEVLPAGWRWVALGDVVDVISGQSPEGRSINKSEGVEFHQGKIAFSRKYILPSEFYTTAPKKIAPAGSVLLSVRAPVGNVNVTDRDICVGRGLAFFRCKDEMNNDYLYYLMSSLEQTFRAKGRGTTFDGITAKMIRTQPIPLPPIDEQRRIVAYLDPLVRELTELEDHLTKFRAARERFRKAAIQDATHTREGEELPAGWRWVRLEDVVTLNPRNHLPDDLPVSFIPMERLEGGFSGKYSSLVRNWGEVRKNFTHFKDGDVIVAKITPCFQNRKSALVSGLTNGYGAGTTELHVLRAKECVLNQYIYYLVKSEYFIFLGANNMQGTAGQKRIRTPFIKNVLIPLPPIDQQRQIVNYLDNLSHQIDIMDL